MLPPANRIALCARLGLCGLAALHGACGARSTLPTCTSGADRPCETVCGAGTQACVGGEWETCKVPAVSSPCTNDCGEGAQTCADAAWSQCVVVEASRTCATPCGQGRQSCVDGGWGGCDGPQPGPPTLTATIRNFTTAHPDFGSDGGIGLDLGIVATELGPDDKPVYVSDASTPTTHGKSSFDEWYRDVPMNERTGLSLPLLPSARDPSVYGYDNNLFFPIDGVLFGNAGLHNYYFTLELVTTFLYVGSETFSFASDDDSWVFLNRRLAVDLGGVHPATARSVSLDAASQSLGIVRGRTYPMHLFFADRRVTQSVLRIDVPAADFGVCGKAMP